MVTTSGIAGTVLVHKIAGACAEMGFPLERVAEIARHAAKCVATMGLALTSCTIPAVGKPTFTLGENEIELGLGRGLHAADVLTYMPRNSRRSRLRTQATATSGYSRGKSTSASCGHLTRTNFWREF